MTTDASAAKARQRRPGPLRVALASAALLAVVFVLLAERVAAGGDPVLRATAAHRAAPRPVLVRRIVRKVIVETTIPANRKAQPTTVSSSPATISRAAASSEPVTRSS